MALVGGGSGHRLSTEERERRLHGLAIGAVVTSVMLAMAWTIVSRTRQIAIDGAAAAGERRFKRLSALQVLLSAYGVAGLSAAFSVAPVVRGTDRLPLFTLVLLGAAVALSAGILLVLIWLGQGGQRAIAPEARDGIRGDATPDAGWKGGLVYYNPNDPALAGGAAHRYRLDPEHGQPVVVAGICVSSDVVVLDETRGVVDIPSREPAATSKRHELERLRPFRLPGEPG